jgi:hypothetical protein
MVKIGIDYQNPIYGKLKIPKKEVIHEKNLYDISFYIVQFNLFA